MEFPARRSASRASSRRRGSATTGSCSAATSPPTRRARVALYDVGGGDNSEEPWFSDDAADWATGFDAVASRDGTRIAVLEDDAADNDGLPTRVVLRLFTAAGPRRAPVFRCELALEAADTYALASPTFSPDGSRIAWAESDGIHAATLGALDDCGAIREQVFTLPGAWEPHWSPAPAPPVPGRAAAPKLTLAVEHPLAAAAGVVAAARTRRARDDQRAGDGAPARCGSRGKKKRFAGVVTRSSRTRGRRRSVCGCAAACCGREAARAARERPGRDAGRGRPPAGARR